MRSASAKTASMSCSISSMAQRALQARAGRRPCAAIPPTPMPAIGSSSSSRRGLAGQRHGDLELALLAMAERRGRHVGARRRGRRLEAAPGGLAQALVVARVGAGSGRNGRHAPGRPAPHCRARVNSRSTEVIWKERAEPQPHPGMGRQAGDVAAGEMDGAGVGREVAGELADQRRLAGAVGADQGVDLARPHVDRDVVGRDQAAEALDQAWSVESSGSAMARAPSRESMPPLA